MSEKKRKYYEELEREEYKSDHEVRKEHSEKECEHYEHEEESDDDEHESRWKRRCCEVWKLEET